MNSNEFEDWVFSIKEMNALSDKLSKDRDKCYRWMAEKIKDAFEDTGNPVPRVFFEEDGSRIICRWFSEDKLFIQPLLILDLHMPFDFNMKLTTEGVWEKILIFYPLGDDSD